MTSQSKMVAFDLCEVLRKIEKKPIYWGGGMLLMLHVSRIVTISINLRELFTFKSNTVTIDLCRGKLGLSNILSI